jgi:tetratricopeptide (TPR) repeat protein
MQKVLISLSRLSFLVAVIFLSLSSCTEHHKSDGQSGVAGDSAGNELTRLTNDIVRNSGKVDPYLNRAVYYIENEMLNEALQDVNKALSIDENDYRVYLTLSDVYLNSGKMQRALDALKKASVLNPEEAEVDVKTARLYLTMSDYKQTFNSLRKALSKDKKNAEAFFISGLANEEMGDTLKAIDSYQMAVESDKTHYDALKQLGILFSIKKDKLAIDYLRNASRLRPDKPDALYVLGMYYQDNGELDKSLSVYEEILQIDSSFKLAWYNKGYVQMVYKQDYKEAIKSFTRAYEYDNTYTDALFNRGYAYELSGDHTKARKDYEQVLALEVNNERAIAGLNRLDIQGSK